MFENCIIKISSLHFKLIVEGEVTCEGTEAIIRRAAEAQSFEDVELALDELAKTGHNKAEFGISRVFMYAKEDFNVKSKTFELIQ